MPRSRNGIERWRGEVSATLDDITKRLDELGERFEKALASHAESDHEQFADLDKRLSDTEKTQSTLVGKIAVASVIGAAITAAVVHRVFG